MGVAAAEVEVGQHAEPLGLACRDLVELLLELGREGVVDQVREVVLEQPGDREREPRRHEGGALLEHVVAGGDGADDRRVGRRAADLEFLEFRDERRLGVASRGPGLVTGRLDGGGGQPLALVQDGEARLRVVGGGVIVGAGDVGLQETGERDGAAGGDELGRRGLAAGQLGRDEGRLDAHRD